MHTAADERHMRRALDLAARGLYSTPPNPAVGCVLVKDGEVVGEGFHERAGDAHAEIAALQAAGVQARGATAIVTLEPCAHHGRTPPCADALVDAGIARVVCAMVDPNPRVNGGGLGRLRHAGVLTSAGLLADEARELNRGFATRMERGRPWVTVKIAASADGRTALEGGESRWITSMEARADVQRLRARASAIVTGTGTVLADDPQLTVRDPSLEMRGRRPWRVVLDTSLRTPATARIVDGDAPTIVFTSAPATAAAAFDATRVRVEHLPASAGGIDLDAVLSSLGALECNEVLVEAGSVLAGAFVARGLADEVVVYAAPSFLGHRARAMLDLPALRSLAERQAWVWHDVTRVGPDLRLTLRPAAGPGRGS